MAIKAIALDVDGVLTDGGFNWGPNREEWKRFCFADVMGISLARKAGLVVALVSGEDSPLVNRFANKLGITDVERDCNDKAHAVQIVASRHGIAHKEICFMGDDVNDLGAIDECCASFEFQVGCSGSLSRPVAKLWESKALALPFAAVAALSLTA